MEAKYEPEADGQKGPMPDAVYYEGIADDVRELWERGEEADEEAHA